MPVRWRSRASRSSRKASQFWLIARSSSREASKPGELARAHLAQRDPRGDALDIADAAQRVAQAVDAVADQHLQRIVALARDAAVAQRPRQPLAKRAAAHAAA